MTTNLYRLDYMYILNLPYPSLALETDKINLSIGTLMKTLFEALQYSLGPLKFDNEEYLGNCIEDLIELFEITSLKLLKAFRYSVYSLTNFYWSLPETTKYIRMVHLDEQSIYVQVQ